MKKLLTIIAVTSMLVAPGAIAEDISYIADWQKSKNKLIKEGFNEFVEGEYDFARKVYLDEFQPVFFAKEMVKICHRARSGMAAVYYSPVEYSESMQSYNRQLEKFTAGKTTIGLMEEMILDSVEYSTQQSIINGMSFSSGYDECNRWRVALQMAEFGM